jgi:hypothetical protein
MKQIKKTIFRNYHSSHRTLTHSAMDDINLRYVFHHVFMPPKLPQEDDFSDELEEWLCNRVTRSAEEYIRSISAEQQVHWRQIVKMLKNTHHRQSKDNIVDVIADMRCGGTCNSNLGDHQG